MFESRGGQVWLI